jgi:heptosyltransferase-2
MPPLNRHARVLWLQTMRGVEHLDCQPCFARDCRFGHLKCLTGIVPERVHAALRDALASSASRPG